MAGTLGINPQQDLAGRLGNECFLCGHLIGAAPRFFGPGSPLLPKLPCHEECFFGQPLATTVREYHQRVNDLLNLKRAS